jgi:hypothetical protein
MFPANARGLASSLLATEIVWIFLSIEHGDQRKKSSWFHEFRLAI